jgi:hypothetical protein
MPRTSDHELAIVRRAYAKQVMAAAWPMTDRRMPGGSCQHDLVSVLRL